MTLAKGPGRKGHAGAASAAMNSPPRPTTLAGAAVPAAMGAPASCRPGLFLALRADRLSFRRKSAKPLRRKSRPAAPLRCSPATGRSATRATPHAASPPDTPPCAPVARLCFSARLTARVRIPLRLPLPRCASKGERMGGSGGPRRDCFDWIPAFAGMTKDRAGR